MPESVNFDRMADRYDASRGGLERGRYIAEEIEPYLRLGRLLEIGVGTGVIAAAFTELGWRVVGVDLSGQMLAQAALRVPGRVAQADAARLPIADDSVDTCLAVHVMHLVGDAEGVVAEVARVLRPGGRFAVVRGGDNVDSSDVTTVTAAMQARLNEGPARTRTEQADAVAGIAARHGLALVEDFSIIRNIGATTPAQAIRSIEERMWSRLWDLSHEDWARAVEPALAELRALPGQEKPRASILAAPVMVFENAAA